ncbi:sodium:solute symporter family protein [Candidatus Woesearchaeota archaeon]|jgi:Na+/proline symporter|nr:sodium:solute symporter family protein [Candidatus Woesearchaeota archaeon]MBT3537298.1 sodium:solute symporter family protein [Candidatus Woesearchaeota archaeon]MBT4696753.1 sodium:solute symporter family protein [Candidatus Woesearchaeota archaeon]MBT7106392.1 sodium:solute symporter family protein [Candidatus Woesearchaeota archaeon]
MDNMLSMWDLLLVVAYFVVLVVIGYISSRKQSDEDFLIAERKLGAWSTMATVNASKTGSIIMIFVAMVYLWGFSAIWYFIGMALGVLVFLPFALKLRSHSGERYYTLSDYFKHNYGKKVAGFASALTIFLMFGFLSLNLMAGTKIFVFFTGWPFWLCALIMVAIVLVYLLLGGFKAVVKTDVIQYGAMFVLLVILAVMIFDVGVIPLAEWNLFGGGIATIVGFFLFGVMLPFGMPELWQRVYSTKNVASLKKGFILSSIVYAIFGALLGMVALVVKAKFPGVDQDLALIHAFQNLLPPGLVGLAVVLLFAAIMSSIDTYVFTASSSVVQDLFHYTKSQMVSNIRKVMFVLCLLAVVLAVLVQDLVLGAFFAAVTSVLSVAAIATWVKGKVKASTLYYSMIFGTVAFVILLALSLIKGEFQPVYVFGAILASCLGLGVGAIVSKYRLSF